MYSTGGRDVGLARDLRLPPPVGSEAEEPDLAAWLASWIVSVELTEPLGTREAGVEEDSAGVLWRTVCE